MSDAIKPPPGRIRAMRARTIAVQVGAGYFIVLMTVGLFAIWEWHTMERIATSTWVIAVIMLCVSALTSLVVIPVLARGGSRSDDARTADERAKPQ